MNTYAIYKGDEFIDLGTIKELSKKHNISEKTLYYYTMPSYKKRSNYYKNNRIIVIKVEE